VGGRCWVPTLHDGDRLLIRYGGRVRPHALVVVRLPDRPIAVKRADHHLDGGWWVVRDNPDDGVDSWALGAIPDVDVVAVVVARVWPLVRRRRASSGGAA
jgi:SOS-response transcriptional repressor LexA